MTTLGRPHVLYLVTHPITARHLLRGQLAYLTGRGFRVGLVASPGRELVGFRETEGVEIHPVRMRRRVAPLSDLHSLLCLGLLLSRLSPDMVVASTPKAAFLGLLAASFLRLPNRIYVLRGLRFETSAGWRRRLLTIVERVTAALAHEVLAVGPSLRQKALELRLVSEDKVTVLGEGSSNGVDPCRFRPLDELTRRRRREELGLPTDGPVVGFVGRLTRDKGVGELFDIMQLVRLERPDTHVLILGAPDATDPVPERTLQQLFDAPWVHALGFVEESSRFMPLLDVLAFPSRREGFPNAPLEAAACAVPAVGFSVTGTMDAIDDGKTGGLVPPQHISAFANALLQYVNDPELCREHGQAARDRVLDKFLQTRIWGLLEERFATRLRQRHAPRTSYLKRGVDITFSLFGLTLLSPLLLSIALGIILTMGPPVLFRQQRPGLASRPFTLFKFRTMRARRASEGEDDAARVTLLGRLLRRTGLDELPELVNVLRGEMSLVGPRPLLMEYLPLYSAGQARRHEVKPGLTGWAQIHGRNALTWEEKFTYDVWYVDRQSLWLDLRILWSTVGILLSGHGVNATEGETMPRFEGSRVPSCAAQSARPDAVARRSSSCEG